MISAIIEGIFTVDLIVPVYCNNPIFIALLMSGEDIYFSKSDIEISFLA